MTNRRTFFNELANTWDRQTKTEKLLSFVEHLVPKFDLAKGQRVLDVGTGTGILIPFLLQQIGPSGSVVAVDFAEKMIEVCKTKYAHLPNVTFAVQQAEKLDFDAESFDAVTCFGLFPHIDDKEEALRQMNRVLKPEGKLAIAHALSSEEIETHHHNTKSVVAHDVLPERRLMTQLLKRAGFGEIHIADKPGCYLCTAVKTAT